MDRVVLAELQLPSTYTGLCFKETGVPPKMRVGPTSLWNLVLDSWTSKHLTTARRPLQVLSTVDRQLLPVYHTQPLSVQLCVPRDGRDAARHVSPSAEAENRYRVILYTSEAFHALIVCSSV